MDFRCQTSTSRGRDDPRLLRDRGEAVPSRGMPRSVPDGDRQEARSVGFSPACRCGASAAGGRHADELHASRGGALRRVGRLTVSSPRARSDTSTYSRVTAFTTLSSEARQREWLGPGADESARAATRGRSGPAPGRWRSWVIDGAKMHHPGGRRRLVVWPRRRPTRGAFRSVERGAAGLSRWKMRARPPLSDTARCARELCASAISDRREHQAQAGGSDSRRGSPIARVLGIARGAPRISIEYAKERKRSEADRRHQAVQLMLADMATRPSCTLSSCALRRKDHGRPFGTEASMAKLVGVGDGHVGPPGRADPRRLRYMREFPSRHMRDAKSADGEGTSEVQRIVTRGGAARTGREP